MYMWRAASHARCAIVEPIATTSVYIRKRQMLRVLIRLTSDLSTSQSKLATSARAHPIQDRRTDIQSSARHSATVPRTTRTSSRSARSAGTPLCQLQSPGGADVPTGYSRQSGIQRFWTSDLEWAARKVVSAPTFSICQQWAIISECRAALSAIAEPLVRTVLCLFAEYASFSISHDYATLNSHLLLARLHIV